MRQQKLTFETEKNWNLSKLKNGQNWKTLQFGTENMYTPDLWKAKPEQPEVKAHG